MYHNGTWDKTLQSMYHNDALC